MPDDAAELAQLEADQTASDSDQTASDDDQTASESDQTTSDRDRAASESDQQASDHDQHASDRESAGKADQRDHDEARNDREDATRIREETLQDRLRSATARETHADERDQVALARDRTADARDSAATAREEAISTAESPTELGQPAEDRRRAASDRASAAQDRQRAATDRVAAAMERADASRLKLESMKAARALETSDTDELTRVKRRGAGLKQLQREIDRARRGSEPLVVGFVDVDGLKRVNDTGGHAAGDALLVAVAESLRSCLRSYDVVVRFGGDEFVCVLPNAEISKVEKRFSEVSRALATARAAITVGFGQLAEGDSPSDLIARADGDLLRRRQQFR